MNIWSQGITIKIPYQDPSVPPLDTKYFQNEREKLYGITLPYLIAKRALSGVKSGQSLPLVNTLIILEGSTKQWCVATPLDIAKQASMKGANQGIISFNKIAYFQNKKIQPHINNLSMGFMRSEEIYARLHTRKITAHLNLKNLKGLYKK